MADFFFIYAEDAAGRASDVASALRKRGVEAAIDRAVPAGERYDAYVADRLARAKAVVILWSEASIQDAKLIDEAAAARDQGKAVPARVDLVEPPLGFRQLQTADLADWGAARAKAGLDVLAAALLRARDGAAAIRPPRPTQRPFLTTAKFWLLCIAIALAVGAIFFVSPEGRREMTAEASVASRAQLLGLYLGIALASVAAARALTHLSTVLVGRTTRAFFNREFLAFAAIAAAAAAAVGLTGGFGDPGLAEQGSFLNTFGSGLVLLPPLMAVGLFLFRAMRRLLFGRVAAD
jgi:hypothetical protein